MKLRHIKSQVCSLGRPCNLDVHTILPPLWVGHMILSHGFEIIIIAPLGGPKWRTGGYEFLLEFDYFFILQCASLMKMKKKKSNFFRYSIICWVNVATFFFGQIKIPKLLKMADSDTFPFKNGQVFFYGQIFHGQIKSAKSKTASDTFSITLCLSSSKVKTKNAWWFNKCKPWHKNRLTFFITL